MRAIVLEPLHSRIFMRLLLLPLDFMRRNVHYLRLRRSLSVRECYLNDNLFDWRRETHLEALRLGRREGAAQGVDGGH